MNRLQVWTLASRPKTLVASVSPALVGATLALTQGTFDLFLFMMTLLTGICIQIGTNLTNDYCDFIKGADTSERKGSLRVTQAGLVSAVQIKRAIALTFLAALISGSTLVYHSGPWLAGVLVLYIALGIWYTAGPKALGYLGLGDLLVLLFYGPGAVLITYYVQTHTFSWEALVVGLSPGALSMAVLIINNIRDIEEDRKAHKRTLPVRLGKRAGQIEFVCAIGLSVLPLIYCYKAHPFCALTLLILLPAIPLMRAVWTNQESTLLNPLFKKTTQLLWLFTLLFCIGWML